MDWWLVTFFIGAIFSLLLPIVPAFFYVFLFILCFMFAHINQVTRYYAAAFLGCAWILLIASHYQGVWKSNNVDINLLVNQVVKVKGGISSIPQCTVNRCRFNFSASHLNDMPLEQKINIRLNWEIDTLTLKSKPLHMIKQGQIWSLFVKIKPAHGLANAGGFSYQTWLRRQHLHATGYVRKKENNQLVNNAVSHRQQQFISFNNTLPQHFLAPIIQALTFGERSGLGKAHWRVLKHTQIQHLIAISGLHIGIVAGCSYFLFLLVVRLIPLSVLLSYILLLKNTLIKKSVSTVSTVTPLLNSNIRIAALFFSALCSGYYAYLAGFSIPTLRALVMIYCFLFFRLVAISIGIKTWLSLTLFLVVLLMPMSLISMSFWLSFYAVICIFFIVWRFKPYFYMNVDQSAAGTHSIIHSTINRFISKSKQLFFLQVSLTLLMLPLATLLSGQVSVVAILANLVAVPVISFVVLPLALSALVINAASTVLADLFINLALAVLSWLWQYLTLLADLPWAVFDLSQKQWALLSLTIFGSLLALVVTKLVRKWLIIPLLLILANIALLKEENSQRWQVKVMDVGQGLAVIVQRNKQVLLYDTGATYPSGFSMAESVLLPYFQQQGIKKLDWLILSHDDNDHAGGFALLNDKLAIENIMTNDLTINANHRCLAGQHYQWQQLTIEILSPNEVKGDDNDDSCVVRISDHTQSVLLSGDISQKIEKRLIKTSRLNIERSLASTILIAPHHGSKTSSSSAFIKTVSPEYAIFSAGFLNHWRMPANEVVERYHRLNVKTFNTAENGMITLDIHDNKVHVKRYRIDDWPYWFAN